MVADKLDYEIRIKVSEQMWSRIKKTMQREDYTVSEYVREAIRRDQRSRDVMSLSSSPRIIEADD